MYCVHCFPGHSPVIPWHSSSSALLPLAISKATAGGVWAHHLKVLSKPCVSSQKHFCFLLNRISSFLASSAISAGSRDSWRDIYTLTSGWHMPEGQWTGQVGDPKQNTKYCHTQKSRPRPSATGVHMYIYIYIYRYIYIYIHIHVLRVSEEHWDCCRSTTEPACLEEAALNSPPASRTGIWSFCTARNISKCTGVGRQPLKPKRAHLLSLLARRRRRSLNSRLAYAGGWKDESGPGREPQDMDSECSERRAAGAAEAQAAEPGSGAASACGCGGLFRARSRLVWVLGSGLRGLLGGRFGSSGLFGVYIGFRARVDCSGFGGFCR